MGANASQAATSQRRVQRRLVPICGGLLCVAVLIIWGKQGCDSGAFPAKMEAGGPFGCAEFWLNRYQTLIGALATLAAAAVAYWVVRLQIDHARSHEAERRERADFAARAALPMALSKIVEHAGGCIRIARDQRGSGASAPFSPPPLEVIPVLLQAAVEVIDTRRRAEIADLIASIQIFAARTRDDDSASMMLDNQIFDAADLYQRASRLFEFGRVSMDPHLVTGDDIRKALLFQHVDMEEWELLPLLVRIRDEQIEAVEKRSEG